MPWVSAGASVASSVLGGAFGGGSKGAERLAKHTSQANQIALGAQQAANTENYQPYLNSGLASNDYLNYLLGTSKAYKATTPRPTMGSIRAEYASLIKAKGLNGGKSYGVRDQARSNIFAQDLYKQKLAEWEQAQQGGVTDNTNDSEFGSLLRPFGQEDLDNDLVYQNGLEWGLNEGTKALDARARASGSSGSGRVLKDLLRFGNDYATTKTGDANNRFMANKAFTYDTLSGGANRGLAAAGGLSGINTNLAGTQASNNTNASNAIGAYQTNNANNQNDAMQSLISNLLYTYKNQPQSNRVYSTPNPSTSNWGVTV